MNEESTRNCCPTPSPVVVKIKMLWLIGLGLFDEKDISVRGLETIKQCDQVFLENYTSILHVPVERLEAFYGQKVQVADREMVESYAEKILDAAAERDGAAQVSFLVVGDPFAATTHADLLLRAEARGISVKVIHNASIMNAVAACGLQLYSFGQTISIPYFTPTWRPRSFYPRIGANYAARLHTLCLLDIKVKEVSDENLARGRKIYEAPRFMSVNEALEQLVECEEAEAIGIARMDALVVGLARVGAPDQIIRAGTVEELLNADFGAPLHALVIPGPELHELEYEMLRKMFMADGSALKNISFDVYKKTIEKL